MAQLPPYRRKAVLAASATAVLASAVLLLSESHGGGGVQSWGQFALGLVIGLALVFGVAAFIKFRSGPKPGGEP
jgi:hypothetical protein